MKTFIVYDLNTLIPVAVGQAIKSEWARFEVADASGQNIDELPLIDLIHFHNGECLNSKKFLPENLLAEEINNELKEIEKNSRPNPNVKRKHIHVSPTEHLHSTFGFRGRKEKIRESLEMAREIFKLGENDLKEIDKNLEAMRRAERYSKAAKEIYKQKGKIPTFEEWLRDGGDSFELDGENFLA